MIEQVNDYISGRIARRQECLAEAAAIEEEIAGFVRDLSATLKTAGVDQISAVPALKVDGRTKMGRSLTPHERRASNPSASLADLAAPAATAVTLEAAE